MSRLLPGLLLVALLAGCGTHAAAPVAPTTHSLRPQASPRVVVSAADVRFARLVVVEDREDLAADALGERKSSSEALSGAALRRAHAQTAEITDAAHILARAHARVAQPTSAQRSAWARNYQALVGVAGWRFDAAFTSGTESRDRAELAAARAEIRSAGSSLVKSLAQRIAAQRAAEITKLRTISA